MNWRTVHCSDREGLDVDDGYRWQDDAPVVEIIDHRGRRLVLDDGDRREVLDR